MQTLLQRIAKKASEQPKYRFQNLCILLTKENLIQCLGQMNKNAAPGVDKVDYEEYTEKVEAKVEDLVVRLKSGKYKARLIRRKYIPKGTNGRRPLGIPITEDKMLQTAVKRILEAIWEADFRDTSYAYRRGRGSKDGVYALNEKLQFGNFQYVVEADIQGFFDAIDHAWLIKMLELRIDDGRFIGLIKKWLKAGVLEEDGKILNPETGTPQGGVVSAVLANIYLHYVLDVWFEMVVKKESKGKAEMVRYADDFVAAFESKEDAETFQTSLRGRLEKFGLTLSEEKTRTIVFSRNGGASNKRFDFLGFEFYWTKSRKGMMYVALRTARKKLRASIQRFSEWIQENRHTRLGELIATLKRKLKGYWNHYGVIGNCKSLEQFFYHVRMLLYKWLNRRSQKRSMNWTKFKKFMQNLKDAAPRITDRRCRRTA
jgi:group II intron reverse transcriptase/maturase